jgi:hypothetical protein
MSTMIFILSEMYYEAFRQYTPSEQSLMRLQLSETRLSFGYIWYVDQ